jgi:hypothetical protein
MQLEEFDRSAAYVAAKSALEVVQQITGGWPSEVASSAKRCATDMVAAIAESLEHGETSSARRRALRGALCNAIELAAICDIARAHGLRCDESLRCAGRTLSLLGLSYHATSIANE